MGGDVLPVPGPLEHGVDGAVLVTATPAFAAEHPEPALVPDGGGQSAALWLAVAADPWDIGQLGGVERSLDGEYTGIVPGLERPRIDRLAGGSRAQKERRDCS